MLESITCLISSKQRPTIHLLAYSVSILLVASCLLSLFYFCCFTTTIIVTTITSISPLLLILCCKQALISGAVELTTRLLKHVRILWLPLCRIYKLGYSYPRRLTQSPTLVSHQELFSGAVAGEHSFIYRSTRNI